MSFEAIVFNRTVPPTVPSQTLPSTQAATSVATPTPAPIGTNGSTSVAAGLANQIGNLIDASDYLQSVIVSLNPGLGISIDPAKDPDTSRSLSQIYGGKVPPAISIKMYDRLLDAELGVYQVNLAAGPSSPVQANPFQHAALLTVNKAIETQFAASGSFSAQSALLLRRLKCDIIANSNIQANLLAYPAASLSPTTTPSKPNPNAIQAATIDISSSAASVVQTAINAQGQNYSSIYQVLAQPDPIASDIGNVLSSLATVSVPNLIQMNGLLQMSAQGPITQSITNLSTGLSAFVFPQMLTQSSGMMMQLDQIVQMAVSPVSNMSNQIGSAVSALGGTLTTIGKLVGVVRSMIQNPTSVQGGPLAGLPLNNSSQSGLANSSPMPTALSSLGFSSGINELSSLVQFSISSTQSSNQLHQDSFQRLTARSNSDSSNLIQSLSISASMTSLMSLVSAFINQQQGSTAIATQSPDTQLATVGVILASVETGNGTTYTVQNGTIKLTPPSIPAPTAGAEAIFSQNGIQTSLAGLTT